MQCGAPVAATLFSSEDVLPHSDFEVTDVKLNAINDTMKRSAAETQRNAFAV